MRRYGRRIPATSRSAGVHAGDRSDRGRAALPRPRARFGDDSIRRAQLRSACARAGRHADRQRRLTRALSETGFPNHRIRSRAASAWRCLIRRVHLMCGIAGYIGTRQVSDQAVERCLQLMERRGPDAHGYRRFVAAGRQVLLVHTRLSIIDLDPRSNQPFNSGRLWTAFNGELYNYVEIGARLRKDGVQLRTQSDTEVLLAAI